MEEYADKVLLRLRATREISEKGKKIAFKPLRYKVFVKTGDFFVQKVAEGEWFIEDITMKKFFR